MEKIKVSVKTKDKLPLVQIKPLQQDLKTLSDNNYNKLKSEILKDGFSFAIHVWEDPQTADIYITDGHQRFETLRRMKEEGYSIPQIPVVFIDADDINHAKKKVLAGASQYGEYNKQGAEQFISSIQGIDIDYLNENFVMPSLDFSELNIDSPKIVEVQSHTRELSKNNYIEGEDDIPEVKETKAKLGDIYQLGNHRLMCGDSTSITYVEKLMSGQKADMVFTSPPYNGDTHLDYGNGNNKKLYKNDFDSKPSEDYIDFCHNILNNIFLVTNGFVFWNVNYNAKSRFEYIKGIYPFIEKLWETIIWEKTGMPIASGLTRNCEFIFCFKNNSLKKHISKDFETEFNLWKISNSYSQHSDHKACFPVALPQKAIEISTKESDLLFEPFGGSGSTLIACEKTNRKCFMMELDPNYCSVIIERWQKFTEQKAFKLNDDGSKIAWDDMKITKLRSANDIQQQ